MVALCAGEHHYYCDARERLPLEVVACLVRQTAKARPRSPAPVGSGKDAKSLMVTVALRQCLIPAVQKAFPQSKSQGIGLGFPLVRYVVIIALATGVVRDLANRTV